ncbi:protein SMAX1-LIKE 3 [Sesamum indicum]|uniref:Protein SMAX1-LIKE 3 n=1 Tax=Sesamum indicum TaxID=4182 RepID=A0A6I9T1W3_SESIN|nr:protein SMAX1-LIKE 3 [Sesamum indicum]
MRTGGYTLHQSLTLESAAIVKQAVSLARRRGHAQVTPLHVASAMISSSTGLLKRACLQSHSHPLQCKALELCFNVALNRLPTSASTPLISPHSHIPSLSNALVAAFKRAQAHQRRGSIENQQQQPILALKVEVEQLVISILDDPSVSRVMREAGFISTQVKTNVEKAVSLEKCSSPHHSKEISTKTLVLGNSNPPQAMPTTSLSKFRLLPLNKTVQQNEDVMSVLEAMMNKNTKNNVIVSESPDTAESLVKGLIEKFDKRDVPDDMKSVQFLSVPLFTLRNISREEFEVKLGELRALVKSYVSRGVVLYLGDLGWVSDYWCKCNGEQRDVYYYCPVEYMIMELSKLICGAEESKKLWLMGVATFQTYAKCRTGRPSLETLWSLHPLTIPAGNLALSLSLDSGMHDQVKKEPVDDLNWLFQKAGMKNQLNFCSDCSVNFKREAQAVMSSKQEPSSSSLPTWLQQYKDENRRIDQECDKLKDLCKKWNSICTSVHKKPHFLGKVFNLSSPSPASSSTSTSSNGLNKSKLHQTLLNWPVVFEPSRPSKEHQTFLFEKDDEVSKPSSSAAKPELLSNPNSSPNSASSSEASQEIMEFSHRYKELSSENLNILCSALEKKVPWQKDIIPEIVSTILRCRSGNNKNENREESWLFFLGVDHDGKETIARELAKNVFGSYDNFIAIGISSFSSSTRADSNEEVSNKRARNEHGGSLYDRFSDAVRSNPSRVFYVEDVDQLDHRSLRQLKSAIKNGSITLADGEVVLMRDAIIVFSCKTFSSDSRSALSPPSAEKGCEKEEEDSDEQKECRVLDLNIATEDGDDELDQISDSETGILDLVDKKVVFKIQVL